MPKNVPIFLFCGENDPVGNYSKGVKQVADRLLEQDVSSVRLEVYRGERHEVLNGLSRAKCYADVQEWIDGVIEGVRDARNARNARTASGEEDSHG